MLKILVQILKFLLKDRSKPAAKKETNEEIIRRVALEYGVDVDKAVRVAMCESSLNEKARNECAPQSIDRGLYQINSYWHPEVTDAQAYDPEFSARFYCKAVKEGHLGWWAASQKCWDK